MTTSQDIHRLARLLHITVRKSHFITIEGMVASWQAISNIYEMTFDSPVRLNAKVDPVTQLMTSGYRDADDAIKVMDYLIERLPTIPGMSPVKLAIVPGYQVQYNGRPAGTKLDFGEKGKRGISFPVELYTPPPVVFFTPQEALRVVTKLAEYAVDQIKAKGYWAGERKVDLSK